MSDQWIRRARLIVFDGEEGIDLSEFKMRFNTYQSDVQSPNKIHIRVTNLATETVQRIKGEYSRLTLEAGYENGHYGLIFDGTITQFRIGKENNTDTYLEIWAADGDIPYNQTFINKTLAAGSTNVDIVNHLAQSFAEKGVRKAADFDNYMTVPGFNPQALTRGKVMYGAAKDYMAEWSKKNGYKWSFQQGELTLVPIIGYREGEAVQLNSQTGLIGIPEAMEDGIKVRCLLNPLIRIGARVQINKEDINRNVLISGDGLKYKQAQYAAPTTIDGFYKVLVVEFVGDTRGQQWYSELICLALDMNAMN